jgi:copper chaperone CopZ
MRMPRKVLLASWCAALALVGTARAETKVEVKGVHLCCPACVTAVGKILKQVDGVKGTCDQKKKTVTLTAVDDQTAQKALDALAAGGFSGETDNKNLTIPQATGAPQGKVTSLSLTGAHNCCGACCKAIKTTLKKVDGVTGDTAKPKADSFTVTGNFDAAEVLKALHAAGFYVKVKE